MITWGAYPGSALEGQNGRHDSFGDLLGPQPTLLPGDEEAEAALLDHEDPAKVAAEHPTASIAWAYLAEGALESGETIAAYAYARTGYHRGLDQLRRNGWKGFGPVPYSHEPNRGFLRCVAVLARAAKTIGEADEHARCSICSRIAIPVRQRNLASSRSLPTRDDFRRKLRKSSQRLRSSALPIVQCALAAGIAWWVATTLIGHPQPFFAPIAAVVSLGLSLGARLRRSVELVCGVTVGIGIGDLIVSQIGSGPWQIALVVAIAMRRRGAQQRPIFAMQAGNSAVLVATLIPPGGTGGIDRMVDALVGGLVGIAVVALIPTHPVRRARKNAADILETAAEVLRKVETGLVENNPKPIEAALRQARDTQSAIDSMRSNLQGGHEVSRISPLYWNSRPRLARLTAAADPIDNAVRNIRVLARRSLTLVRDDEILDSRSLSSSTNSPMRSRYYARWCSPNRVSNPMRRRPHGCCVAWPGR